MASAKCCRAVLGLRLELTATGRLIAAAQRSRSLGTLCRNETWCRRWWNISRKGLSTGTRSFTPSLSPILSKEQQHYKESKESRGLKDAKVSKDGKESKDTKKESKEAKESKKLVKETSSSLVPPEVTIEYLRGLPRITLPLPSRPEKCMFTLKPITQTVGDFIDMLKQEDPAIIDAHVTTINGVKMGGTNRLETMLMDDFNLIINDKIYPVSPPVAIESSKENIRQLRDLQALVSQLYETFNAREHQAQMEQEVLLQLEEVKLELEPLEQMRLKLEEAAERRSRFASWGVLVLMSIQFGCLARLTWWEYSWDIMEPVTYFVTYATAMGCYIYFMITKQEYVLQDVFQREHLIGLHKKARKERFDLERYNILKDEAYALEMMLRIIRGPLHSHQMLVEQKRRERRGRSSSSSSSSESRSPSPTPERSAPRPEEAKEQRAAA